MDLEAGKAVVIDSGSGSIKAGFSGEDAPRVECPTLIGEPKHKGVMMHSHNRDYFLGHEAIRKRGILNLRNPVKHGIVTNWDDMTKLIQNVYFNELRINPEEYPVLMTEAPMNPKSNREIMTQIFFETFHCPSFYIAIQAILSLYSSGKTTGLVIDSGDGVTHSVPIYEGFSLPHAVKRLDFAGRDITEYLIRLLTAKGYKFVSSSEKEIVRDIKEKICFVSYDYKTEIKNVPPNTSKAYELPDGQIINIGEERFKCPEMLFDPSIAGLQSSGLPQTVWEAVNKCDIDIRQTLFSNIVLSGGSTLFPGMAERIQKELHSLTPPSVKIRVTSFPERKYSVWIGGAILSSLSTFKNMSISSEEYFEYGPEIVHRKCF